MYGIRATQFPDLPMSACVEILDIVFVSSGEYRGEAIVIAVFLSPTQGGLPFGVHEFRDQPFPQVAARMLDELHKDICFNRDELVAGEMKFSRPHEGRDVVDARYGVSGLVLTEQGLRYPFRGERQGGEAATLSAHLFTRHQLGQE